MTPPTSDVPVVVPGSPPSTLDPVAVCGLAYPRQARLATVCEPLPQSPVPAVAFALLVAALLALIVHRRGPSD